MNRIIFEKVREVKTLSYSKGNAGIDFFVPEKFDCIYFKKKDDGSFEKIELEQISSVELKPGESIKITAGIKFDIPKGYAIDLLNKSGVAMNGLTIGSELIDSSYTGEFNFHFIAHLPYKIESNMKIAQGIIIKDYIENDFVLEEGVVDKITDRGSQGFGSNYQDKQ